MIRFSRSRLLLLFIGCLLLTGGVASSGHCQQQTFTVSVRAVHAEGMLNEEKLQSSEKQIFDPKLSDIKEKLNKLPFKTFKVLSENTHDISLREKDSMRLGNGQKLCLRAVDANADTVTVWFRWSDAQGNTLLDTRINFARNETMVAGVESAEENTGVVLAVRVS